MDINVENVEQCGEYLTIEEEGVAEVMKDGKVLWDDSLTEKFCNIMEEQVRAGNRTNTTFNPKGWTTMVKEMKVQTGIKFDKTQLRNKFNQLRTIYIEFKKLLSETGVGYNHETGMVIVEEERWGRLSKVIKGTNKFRRHGYKHFDKMSTIFGDTYEEGCHVSPPPLRKSKKAKRDSLSPSMAALLSGMDENSARRTERMEAAIEKAIKASSTSTRVSSCEKGDDEVLSPSKKDKDDEMFEACMLLLQKIPGIEMAQFAKVSKLLHDSEKWQKFFLSSPEEIRIGWALNV
ncbi:L10-interacting MYB domain-containing protein-like [Cornus florida]|uniref:L10-interacting MYB domain-containing protein-like n=1 Tax=Cornus florida TaxID=4283 RepID=UPI00289B9F62|nr:L10-interacting MYB domain-containing protein-like [Cornus florida]